MGGEGSNNAKPWMGTVNKGGQRCDIDGEMALGTEHTLTVGERGKVQGTGVGD